MKINSEELSIQNIQPWNESLVSKFKRTVQPNDVSDWTNDIKDLKMFLSNKHNASLNLSSCCRYASNKKKKIKKEKEKDHFIKSTIQQQKNKRQLIMFVIQINITMIKIRTWIILITIVLK